MHLLKSDELTKLLTSLPSHEIDTISTALSTALTDPTVCQPHRTTISAPDGITTLFMPCTLPPSTSLKTVIIPPGGPVRATLTLYSSTGALSAVLPAADLTGFRTALASMLLLRRRALPPDFRVVIFGTGLQARWALRLLPEEITNITVVGRGDVRAKLGGGRSYMVGEREAVKDADAVFCCTSSATPLFPAAWVKKECYVSAIGGYRLDMMEVDPGLLVREGTTVVVDQREACWRESGEVVGSGITKAAVWELGDALAQWRENCGGAVLFKCVGLAVMDLVVGREVMRIAKERGVGIEVDGFD